MSRISSFHKQAIISTRCSPFVLLCLIHVLSMLFVCVDSELRNRYSEPSQMLASSYEKLSNAHQTSKKHTFHTEGFIRKVILGRAHWLGSMKDSTQRPFYAAAKRTVAKAAAKTHCLYISYTVLCCLFLCRLMQSNYNNMKDRQPGNARTLPNLNSLHPHLHESVR